METVSFFENLKILLAMCTFLSTKQSPAGILSPTCLPYVLEQYSLFPKNIVCMLTLAKGAAAPWPGVAAELQRNIDQELGSDSGNVPHYVLLANAIRAEFGVEVWGVTPGAATDQFIRSMWATLRSQEPLHILGAAYALESTAVPELAVVLELTQRLCVHNGRSKLLPPTEYFFHKHLGVWEPSHEEELRLALEPALQTLPNRTNFENGFNAVIQIMYDWWLSLAAEAATF